MTDTEIRRIRRHLVALVESGLYTNKELAADLGMTESVLSRARTGVRDMSEDWVRRYSKGILAVAIASGNNDVRDIIYALEDEAVEDRVQAAQKAGKIYMPVTKASVIAPHKRRGTVR